MISKKARKGIENNGKTAMGNIHENPEEKKNPSLIPMLQGHSSNQVKQRKLGKTDSKNINISQFNILQNKTLYNTTYLYMFFLCPTVPLSHCPKFLGQKKTQIICFPVVPLSHRPTVPPSGDCQSLAYAQAQTHTLAATCPCTQTRAS